MRLMNRERLKYQAIGAVSIAVFVTGLLGTQVAVTAQTTPPPAAAAKPDRRSSLPKEALEKARQAEKLLAANQPDQAIAILQELDKQHPGNPAINLRLAEVHDTLSRYGYALVYYRRYVLLAGQDAREMAAARVQTLELMAGIDDDAAAAAKALGVNTVPVATPAPRVERMIAAEAKDGTLVPLTSEEDLKNIRSLTAKAAAASPAVTPTHTPIIIPETLSATPAPVKSTPGAPAAAAAARNGEAMTVSTVGSAPQAGEGETAATSPGAAAPRAPGTSRVSVYSGATPAPADKDALLAKAFVKADSPATISIEDTKPEPEKKNEPATRATPLAQRKDSDKSNKTQASGDSSIVPSLGDAVAYTKATPVSDSARGASFFHVSKSNSSHAQVVILNDLPQGVVTISIIPPDDREVLSAILVPGESKTLYVPQGRYQVTANASTTDYSPITLMNTQFQYTFQAGRQYTRRVTPDSVQRVN